jgi:hypothetical protein
MVQPGLRVVLHLGEKALFNKLIAHSHSSLGSDMCRLSAILFQI